MATVDLGKLKPVWKGTWAGSTSYEKDDMVQEGVNSYICTTAHTSDASTFSNDSANWDTMATGANIPSQTGNSGKVLKTDGSSLSWGDGLPTGGTSGQYITTDGTTASWGTVSSDCVQVASYSTTSTVGSVELENIFSSDYKNYRISITTQGDTLGGQWLVIRLKNGTSSITSSNYESLTVMANSNNLDKNQYTSQSYWLLSNTTRPSYPAALTMNISNVGGASARYPIATFTGGGWDGTGALKTHSGFAYYYGNTGDADGISIFQSSGNITGIDVTVHGFK